MYRYRYGILYCQDDLPELGEQVPLLVRELVRSLLARQPEQRPTARQAATTCQLLLWAPSHWYRQINRVNRQQVLQWLLTMTTKVLCESR
jgi:eukaryotic-like serine/threonine-protein kinase